MKWKVDFFKGLSKMEGLEKLMKFEVVKKSFIENVLPEEDFRSFKVENETDLCLTISNDKYLIFVLTSTSNFLISEIRLAIDKIEHYIPIIVQFEETTKLLGFKNLQALGVRQISDVAVKNGISYKNPFLIYLRILFDQKPY
jgi:hypothetical protein